MTSEAQKKASLKWYLKNKEYITPFLIVNNRAYKARNRELISARNKAYYLYRMEAIRFRNILL